MPVTNRGGLGGGLPGGEYLYGQSPSWESIQKGLAIFALFVIVRYCVLKTYSWLKPAERPNHHPHHPSSYRHPHPIDKIAPQRYHHQQPYSWSMADEKASFAQGQRSEGIVGGQQQQQQQQQQQPHHPTSEADDGTAAAAGSALPIHGPWRLGNDSIMSRHFISRLPPAPPLTPPELSSAVFTLEERSQKLADHESLIHQPNPDYTSTSTSTSSFKVDDKESFIPRRRSYTKSLPMGASMRQSPHSASPVDVEARDHAVSPRSFSPRSSRFLPPTGSSSTSTLTTTDRDHEGIHGEVDVEAQRNMDVQGEIISVLGRDGAGWTRHTRVYGGGACLACAASGGGGFYGATVTPEEMR